MNSNDHKSVSKARRGPGRPPDLLKRDAILDAASALFLEHGIAATTMEAVAARAAVSKMTLYGHFADKPMLLMAVFKRNLSAIELPQLAGDESASALELLSDYGERLVTFLTRPEIVRTARVMAASANEYPELAAAFYAAGPAAVLTQVAKFLGVAKKKERLRLPDQKMAAEQLVAAWLGVDQLKQSLGVSGPPSRSVMARRVRSATEAMLRGWAR
jgi:TetR/AcrR family transcriptional repressor of mexJK operon